MFFNNNRTSFAGILAGAVGTTFTAVVWTLGGLTALAYLAIVLLATAPGLPAGFRLFGRRHPLGWVTGMLLGYAATSLLLWGVVYVGRASSITFLSAWAAAAVLAWFPAFWHGSTGRAPLIPLRDWTSRDMVALLLVLLLVPALSYLPFKRIESPDAQGNRRTHAYFTADFVWHMALVAELKKHDPRPRNPYLASEPIHYYWTYFMVPAAAGPLAGADVALSLKVNALATAVLFLAAIYLFAWVALPAYPFLAAVAVWLTVLASSVEGWVAIGYLWSRGEPLQHLRDLNVDAIARGVGGLRIDDLPRAFWYTPQHAMSYALGLVALPVGIVAGSLATWPAIALAGLALGASVTLNPLVGALFCIVYALLVLVDAGARQAPFRNVLRHAVAAIPVLLALGWTTFNKVAEGAGAVLHIGLFGPAANAPVVSFLLSFGPILILVLIGLWPQRTVAFRQVFAAAAGVALSVLVMHLLTMTVDLFWVGFRTGHLFLVFAPALVARGLVRLAASGAKAVVAASALVFVLGMPTTAIDAFNAQDVDNDHMGPGFHWTVTITAAEQEALAWIRQQTPVDAIVQADPIVRGRETWSLIPTWGERRMAGGQPISLMHVPAYDTTSAQIRQIYATLDVLEAWRIARQLHIDFLYVGAAERHAYPQAAKFERRPDLFAPAFDNAEVTIYAVARDPVEAHR